jgi:glycosyltransferase involved in cell wall biosynthesis
VRVGFDATSLTMRRTGIGRYTLELLRALHEYEPSIELILMAHRRVAADVTAGGLESLASIGGPGLPVKMAWMQYVLPLHLSRRRVDLAHFTNYHAPLVRRVPYVVNIHDTSLITSPERHPAKRVIAMRPLLRAMARRSEAVLTLTESARQDVIAFLGVDPQRVRVVPAAPAPGFGPIDDAARLDAVARRFRLERGFLLFVGTIEPRKNLVRLIEAYARLRRDGFDKPLVICGGWGWKSSDIKPTVAGLGLESSVVFTGFVSDDDLMALLNLAGAFVYPSLYEGYGLPIIEALACGLPTVTSNRGATAEVAGDAALLVDPEDTAALAEALALALSDEPTRTRLRAAGFRRAADFSWERAAHETVRVYRDVLESRS